MTIETFNAIVHEQIDTCTNMLTGKGLEYAPDAAKEKGPEVAPLGYEKKFSYKKCRSSCSFQKGCCNYEYHA